MRGFGKALWRRKWMALAVLLIVGIGAFSTTRSQVPETLDPDSTELDGAKAARLLIEELGADFKKGSEPPLEDGTVLLLRDDLSADESDHVAEWVRTGGRAVVDGSSSLALDVPSGDVLGSVPNNLAPECDSDVVRGVTGITVPPSIFSTALKAGPGDVGCFPIRNGEYFLVEHRVGLGTVYVVATPNIFTNENLGAAYNSVLVANLVDARPGASVVYGESADLVAGDESLIDLIPGSAQAVLWQLAVASLVLIFFAWRRLGRPIEEPQPVETPASALVVAAGAMTEKAGRNASAATTLRNDLRRLMIERLGLPRDATNEVVVDVASVRTNVPRRVLEDALWRRPVNDGKSLVELAQQIESIHQEVVHGR